MTQFARRLKFAAWGGLLLALFALLAVACDGDGAAPTPTAPAETPGATEVPTTPAEPDKVTIQLGWIAWGQYAAVFWGQESGIYAEEGIDADIIQGGSGGELQLTAQGQRDFMVATLDDLPIAINDGAPLKAVALIGRDNPSGILVRGDSDITRPLDLEGKTVAYPQFGGPNTGEEAIRRLVEADGGDPSAVNTTAADPGLDLSLLLTNQVDALSSFIYERLPLGLKEDPDMHAAIFYKDFGFDFPGIGITTRTELVDSNPDLVRRFVRATARSFAEVVGHEEEAIEAARNYYAENYEELEPAILQLNLLQETIPSPVGVITDADIQALIDGLISVGAMEEQDVQDLNVYFTDEFLPDPPIEKPA